MYTFPLYSHPPFCYNPPMSNQAYPQLSGRPVLADAHANRVLAAADTNAPSVHTAMHRLANARDRLLAIETELFKRLHPVTRVQPPTECNQGCPGEPSTNCQLADDVNGIANDLEQTCARLEYQLTNLQV